MTTEAAATEPPFLTHAPIEWLNEGNSDDLVERAFMAGVEWQKWQAAKDGRLAGLLAKLRVVIDSGADRAGRSDGQGAYDAGFDDGKAMICGRLRALIVGVGTKEEKP